MTDSERFRTGDVVVLNGHRLTVERVFRWGDGTTWVDLGAPNGEPVLADWLPDPEVREEPEPDYPSGSAWRSASGFNYLRRSDGWVSALGERCPDSVPLRPLVRLVPEPNVKVAVEKVWSAFEGTGRPLDSSEAAVIAYEVLFPGEPS